MPRVLVAGGLLLLTAMVPAGAVAQRRLVHDTLGPDTPTGLSCGFCAGERFGVVFRELPPPRRGLAPSDFPIVLDTVEIGLAAAAVSGGACEAQEAGGTVEAAVEIWVGTTPPSGAIRDLPELDAWNATESLAFATDAAPLELSVADASGQYQIVFNVLELVDEAMQPIRIEEGGYLRVVVTLPMGSPGSSDLCEPMFASPAGYPVRDDDGRIADERSFIYAGGLGWYWNEEVPGGDIAGDWGIRIGAFTEGPGPATDGGVAGPDAGARSDAGGGEDAGVATDAAAAVDGGAGAEAGGCGCRVLGARAGTPLGLLALAGWAWARRRRA